jgi:outer membrane lipoprotein-sorting protein
MKIRYEMPAVVEGAFSTTMIMDLDANVLYTWYPDQNIACQTTMDPTTDNPMQDVDQIIPVKVGTETLNGKTCDVYQYTFEDVTEKVWVWKEKSFPIKMEATTPSGTTVIEYQNIVFGNLSDSLFTIPSSVQMQPYPCYPMPSFSFPST